MVDPANITNYSLNRPGLEQVILFWVCAAGKNGMTSARCLDAFLTTWRKKIGHNASPFAVVRYVVEYGKLAQELRKHGIGCYNQKARTFEILARSGIDLKRCSLVELEAIPGIGPKTARCFLIHSRPGQQYAGLDTHVLKFLRSKGHAAPMSTPSGKKYRELEQIFLGYVKESGMTVAEFDLKIWNYYRSVA